MSKPAEARRRKLESRLDILFYEIGQRQTIVDDFKKRNVFRLKQDYTSLQNDYFDMTGRFYEPKDLNS